MSPGAAGAAGVPGSPTAVTITAGMEESEIEAICVASNVTYEEPQNKERTAALQITREKERTKRLKRLRKALDKALAQRPVATSTQPVAAAASPAAFSTPAGVQLPPPVSPGQAGRRAAVSLAGLAERGVWEREARGASAPSAAVPSTANPFTGADAEAAWHELQELRAFKASLVEARPVPLVEAQPLALARPAPSRSGAATSKAAKLKEARREAAAAKVKKERSELKVQRKRLRLQLERLRRSATRDRRKLMELEKSDSMGLARLLASNIEDLPPSMAYLRPLINCQLAVLKSKSGRCNWHPAVLEAASAIFCTSRSAYAELVESGLGAMPSYERIRKLVATAASSSTGHDAARYKALGKEVAEWPEKMRECALLYDEVNLVGALQFKKVGHKFCFFGMVDDPGRLQVFGGAKELTEAERIATLKAKAALVFQLVYIHDVHGSGCSEEKVMRRVCGVHAVSSPPAEVVEGLQSETIMCLEMEGIHVIATSSDGASAFRLMQKESTSGQGRGTANVFVTTTRRNPERPGSVINMTSDISHLQKKGTTNLYKRDMRLPNYLAQMVFKSRPYPGACACACACACAYAYAYT